MTKKIVLPALLAALLLAGCGERPAVRAVTDQEMNVSLFGEEVTALFTGTLEEGAAEGVLGPGEGWRYEGTLAEGELLSGTAESLPYTLWELTGEYTGPIIDGLPEGSGSFAGPSGTEFAGVFAAGAPVSGRASELPVTVQWGDGEYRGTFSGTISQGRPEGPGSFSGENAAGQSFFWEGGWSAGAPTGEGTLRADRLVTPVEEVPLTGAYDGQGQDGVPSGEGSFVSVNEEGVPFTYDGQWADGLMDGRGTLRYESENYYVREGTFTKGRYTPTWMESLAALGTREPRFTLTEEQEAFISRYPALWEAEDHLNFLDSEYGSLFDRSLTLQVCYGDPQSFLDEPRWMRIHSLRAVRSDSGPVAGSGAEMTSITAADSTYTMPVRVIVPGHMESLSRGRRFHVYALPIAISEYTTVLGERQQCLVLLAGDVYLGS